MSHPHPTLLRAVCARPWAITAPGMALILSVLDGSHETVEAVEARLGRKLDNTRTVTIQRGVATIPVTGPIFRHANLLTEVSGATAIGTLATDLQAALDDPHVTSILLALDSPGGEVSGTSEFADMVRAAADQKPVIAYIENLACSAAYWIASACTEIVINATGTAGSIGCMMATQSDDDEDVITFVSSQSPYKNVDPASTDGAARVQAMVDDIAAVFIEAVATNRGVSVATVLSDFGQGDVFVGQKAVDAGLADRVGTRESVYASLTQGGSMFRSQSSAAPAASIPTRRTNPMKALAWLKGKAEAEGVDLDTSDLEAAVAVEMGADVQALAEQVKAQTTELEALREIRAEHERRLAEAAVRERETRARGMADALVTAHRLAPGSVEAFTTLASTIFAAETLSGESTLSDALVGLTASLPDMSLFTTNQIQPDHAVVIPSAHESPDLTPRDERANPDIQARMLAATQVGRAAAASKSTT